MNGERYTRKGRSGGNLQPVAEGNSAISDSSKVGDDGGGAWIRISEAIRLLHLELRHRLSDAEPAPWIERPTKITEQVETETTLRHRQMARTSLTMRRALLCGDLTAHLVNSGQSEVLPRWAWENGSASESAFQFGWFPLDPFRDHGLHDKAEWRCYLERSEFEQWLADPTIAELGELPRLPSPSAGVGLPDPITYREPRSRAFITLTEAITWIAFSLTMTCEEFAIGEQCQFGPFANLNWADATREAMASFADQAGAGNIKVRGRYVSNYADHSAAKHADTAYLSDTQLRDFARFDSLHGGLERGAGLVWEANVLEHALEARGDGWRDVEVCRADLLQAFPPEVKDTEALLMPLPAALPEIGPVLGMEEALCQLAYDRPSFDIQVFQNAAGDLIFGAPDGSSLDQREKGASPSHLDAYRRAARVIHIALRDGTLSSYVAPSDDKPLSVPRLYWNGVNPEAMHQVYRGMAPRNQGAGCPLLLSRQSFDTWRTKRRIARKGGESAPVNRQLDHEKIIQCAVEMLRDQPGVSKGSAALSIVADLPPNPRTGKPRDTRHIERMIAHLWEGKVPQSPV
jgi:hypothetical protein